MATQADTREKPPSRARKVVQGAVIGAAAGPEGAAAGARFGAKRGPARPDPKPGRPNSGPRRAPGRYSTGTARRATDAERDTRPGKRAAVVGPGKRETPDTPDRPGGGRRRGGLRLPATSGGGGSANYQAVIVAEFVVAELLAMATPIATNKQTDNVSPYAGKDLVKWLSLGVVYFLLALLAGTNRGAGRFAAWFGGLILLSVAVNEGSALAKVLSIFGGPGVSASAGPGAGGPLPTPSGTQTPPIGVIGAGAAGAIIGTRDGFGAAQPAPTPSGTQTLPIGDLG